VERIYLAPSKDHCRASVNTEMNLQVPCKLGDFYLLRKGSFLGIRDERRVKTCDVVTQARNGDMNEMLGVLNKTTLVILL
jgi:hypothetical protein